VALSSYEEEFRRNSSE